RTAIIAQRRMLGIAGAQLVLDRRRDGAQVVECTNVGGPDAGGLELAAKEWNRASPDAIEQRFQTFELQRGQPIARHRLDLRLIESRLRRVRARGGGRAE